MSSMPKNRRKMDGSNLPVDIPIDENYARTHEPTYDDEASVRSIGSSNLNFRFEHGRLYHESRSDYPFPQHDEDSVSNERAFHGMMLAVLNNRSIVAPVPKDNLRNILDLGYGLGLWAMDVADAFPDCHVLGVDTCAPVPTIHPNITFQNDDISEVWLFDDQSTRFDLIHIRNMFATLNDNQWPQLYKQCFDYARSGGWIEQIEVEITAHCDDDTRDPNSVIYELCGLTEEFSRDINRTYRVADRMASLIGDAGFVDLQERSYKLPLGGWSSDQRYKAIGHLCENFYRTGLQGWIMAPLTRGKGETSKQVDERCRQAFAEIDSRQYHYYFLVRIVVGKKP